MMLMVKIHIIKTKNNNRKRKQFNIIILHLILNFGKTCSWRYVICLSCSFDNSWCILLRDDGGSALDKHDGVINDDYEKELKRGKNGKNDSFSCFRSSLIFGHVIGCQRNGAWVSSFGYSYNHAWLGSNSFLYFNCTCGCINNSSSLLHRREENNCSLLCKSDHFGDD